MPTILRDTFVPWDVFRLHTGYWHDAEEAVDGFYRDARFADIPMDHAWNPQKGAGEDGILMFGSQSYDATHDGRLRAWDPDTGEVATVRDFRALDGNGEVYVHGVAYSPTRGTLFVGVKPRSNYNNGGTGYLYELNALTFATIRTCVSGNALWDSLFECPSDPGGLWAIRAYEGFGQNRGQLWRFNMASATPWPITTGGPHWRVIQASLFDEIRGIAEASGRVWTLYNNRLYSRVLPFNSADSNSDHFIQADRPQTLTGFSPPNGTDLLLGGIFNDQNSYVGQWRAYPNGEVGEVNPAGTLYEDDLHLIVAHQGAFTSRPDIWSSFGGGYGSAIVGPATGRLWCWLRGVGVGPSPQLMAIAERNPRPWTIDAVNLGQKVQPPDVRTTAIEDDDT